MSQLPNITRSHHTHISLPDLFEKALLLPRLFRVSALFAGMSGFRSTHPIHRVLAAYCVFYGDAVKLVVSAPDF